MKVKTLQLRQFRNYRELALSFSPGKNLFLGQNGQGKTNLLEALYFLSHARSHRTHSDRELIQARTSAASISAELSPHGYEGRQLLDARITLDGEPERLKTVLKANSSTLRSRSDLLGYLPTVSFFLPDLLLLRGSPEDRRRWLDAAITQYDKRHLGLLAEFQKIRQQKNRLLKDDPSRVDRAHLAVWNERFAAAGAKVIASRMRYLLMIESLAAAAYLELSNGHEQLGWQYLANGVEASDDESMLEARLGAALEAAMPDEIRRGTSLVGPHRDDIRFDLDGMEAAAYGSQGQQRSIVLALKLTELQCLTARLQQPPVLLLDDVMAELDPQRQRLLVEHIDPQSQVFITTTHPADTWQALLGADMAVYRVEKGVVQTDTPVHWPDPAMAEEPNTFSTNPVLSELSERDPVLVPDGLPEGRDE